MNNRLLGRFTLVALGVTALFATGCASTGTNLLNSGGASVVTVDQPTPLAGTQVVQAGDELVISGDVKRRVLGTASANPGHVDVVVYDARGAVLAKASHMVRFSVFTAKNQTRTLAPQAGFSFRFPVKASEGTQVRLAFHETTPFSWSNLFDCGDNRAAAQVSRNS